jgi:hypothetical protein
MGKGGSSFMTYVYPAGSTLEFRRNFPFHLI